MSVLLVWHPVRARSASCRQMSYTWFVWPRVQREPRCIWLFGSRCPTPPFSPPFCWVSHTLVHAVLRRVDFRCPRSGTHQEHPLHTLAGRSSRVLTTERRRRSLLQLCSFTNYCWEGYPAGSVLGDLPSAQVRVPGSWVRALHRAPCPLGRLLLLAHSCLCARSCRVTLCQIYKTFIK